MSVDNGSRSARPVPSSGGTPTNCSEARSCSSGRWPSRSPSPCWMSRCSSTRARSPRWPSPPKRPCCGQLRVFRAIVDSLNSVGRQLAADVEAGRYMQHRSLPLASSANPTTGFDEFVHQPTRLQVFAPSTATARRGFRPGRGARPDGGDPRQPPPADGGGRGGRGPRGVRGPQAPHDVRTHRGGGSCSKRTSRLWRR